MNKSFSIFIAAVLLCGCATSNKYCGSGGERLTFARPYDIVWNAVLAELTNSYPVEVRDLPLGLIQTEEARLSGGVAALQEFACEPKALFENWSDARVATTIEVKRAGDAQTTVQVHSQFFGFDNNGRVAWYPWTSNGSFEAQFLARVLDRLWAEQPTAARAGLAP